MTIQNPSMPTPTAVPWTPDMAPTAAPQMHTQMPAQVPQAPAQQAQPMQGYAPAPAQQPYAQMPQSQTQFQQPPMQQPHMPPQFQARQQMNQVQGQVQGHMPQPPHMQSGYSAQHMAPAMSAPEAPAKAPSKSLLAGLLSRSPKAAKAEPVQAGDAKASGSLFDKNFVIGLVAGTVLGFVVLPMALGSKAAPEQAAIAQSPALDETPLVDQVLGEAVAVEELSALDIAPIEAATGTQFADAYAARSFVNRTLKTRAKS